MSEASGVLIERQFPCSKCGAKLHFAPGTDALVCPYCGTRNEIPESPAEIPLLDYQLYAEQKESAELRETLLVKCGACGAQSKLAENVIASRCPFCGSPLVAEQHSKKLIKPGAVLPFIVSKPAAQKLFHGWISELWFAPGGLAKQAEQSGIDGAYVPAWLYYADTISNYFGQRGIDYTVMETYTTTDAEGHTVTIQRPVTRTNWTAASGTVAAQFGDLLVLATQSLPKKQAEHLEPWDLQHLKPYADEYLSGMFAQSYEIDLPSGFDIAKQLMDPRIRMMICHQIGGDHQVINSMQTEYDNVQFRHVLLPLWISAYRYQGRTFRFLINARTGEVQGERPYSALKIAILVIFLLAILAIVLVAINSR